MAAAAPLFSYCHPIRASTATITTTTTTTRNLEEKFGRKGIRFSEFSAAGVPEVELKVRNGSSLRVSIPGGIVTSYKPKVYWRDDGFKEIVHTIGGGDDGGVRRGGIGLVLNNNIDNSGRGLSSLWSADEWEVKDSDSDSIDAVQVELSCKNGNGTLEITYIISLYSTSMATAVIVKNKGHKKAILTGGILSHFKFKNQFGTAIQGLRGCSYQSSHLPLPSNFSIIPPSDAAKPEDPGWSVFNFGNNSKRNNNNNNNSDENGWAVEDDKYTLLRKRISRVYAVPPKDRLKRIYNTMPSNYETIDQGNGLGFRIIKMGYDDIYVGSPGSEWTKYGKEYFICTGPASMLVPVVLNPGEGWRGAQVIEHDNL